MKVTCIKDDSIHKLKKGAEGILKKSKEYAGGSYALFEEGAHKVQIAKKYLKPEHYKLTK